MTEIDLQPTPVRSGAVRAAKPRAARRRTAKVLAPAISAFAIAGIALVAVAQGAAPVQEAASVPSVDEIAQAQAQGYSAALVGEEAPAADAAITTDRGGDVGSVEVVTPTPTPTPVETKPDTGTSGTTGGTSTGGSGSSGSDSDDSGSISSAPYADYSTSELKSLAASILSSRGFGQEDFNCFAYIVNKESSWNPRAQNPSSGAYGLMQALPGSKMSSHGSDWATNPETQIRWGLDYMVGRYGSPCGAYNFWINNSWY